MRFGLVSAVVALFFSGCQHQASQAEPASVDRIAENSTAPAVRLVKPVLRTMTHTIAQPGFVEAYEQTSIYSKVSGFIKKFSVDIGDRVKKGQVLCEVFVPELQEEEQEKTAQIALNRKGIEQAQRLVDVAQRAIQTAKADLEEAKANVGRYQAEVVRWTSEVKRETYIAKEGVLDKQVLDESQNQLDQSKAAEKAARADVTAKEAAVQSREADLAKAKVDVEFAMSRVKVSEAEERRAAALVAYTKIAAPYDGIITVRNANTGDYVQAATGDKENSKGVPIFVVARTDLLRVFVDVPETYARYVHEGTKALVHVESLHGAEIPAKVARTSWDLNPVTRALRTEIDLAAKDYDGLRPRMYVTGTVIIDRTDVRALPEQAITVQGDRAYCFLVVHGKAVKTEVQRGMSDGTWVEVLGRTADNAWTPFTGDEEAIMGDLSDIVDGQSVRSTREKPLQSAARQSVMAMAAAPKVRWWRPAPRPNGVFFTAPADVFAVVLAPWRGAFSTCPADWNTMESCSARGCYFAA